MVNYKFQSSISPCSSQWRHMNALSSQITDNSTAYSIACSCKQKRIKAPHCRHFVSEINQWPAPHNGPIMRKAFPRNDVFMVKWNWHAGVMIFTYFTDYWYFVRGIHQWAVFSQSKRPVMPSFVGTRLFAFVSFGTNLGSTLWNEMP